MQQGQSSKHLNFLCLSVAPLGKLLQHVKNSFIHNKRRLKMFLYNIVGTPVLWYALYLSPVMFIATTALLLMQLKMI